MQIVMLAFYREIRQPLHDRAGAMADVDGVFNAVTAGMADPLPAGDKLPFGVVAERIAHAAVASRQPHTGANRFGDVLHIIVRDVAHGPARHQQIQLFQLVQIRKAVQRVADGDLKPLFLQHTGEPFGGELRFVTVPASLKNQCAFHCPSSFVKCDSSAPRPVGSTRTRGRSPALPAAPAQA